MKQECLLISAIALACAGSAYAQSTLGEILDGGAKKITKEEWMAMLPVKTTDFWPGSVGETELTYKPDGSIFGNAYHYASGSSSPATGTWTVDDSGKVCIAQRNTGSGFQSWEECSIRYQLGDKYFRIVTSATRGRIAGSDSDRSTKIIKAPISK
jgi:hypothetical protein